MAKGIAGALAGALASAAETVETTAPRPKTLGAPTLAQFWAETHVPYLRLKSPGTLDHNGYKWRAFLADDPIATMPLDRIDTPTIAGWVLRMRARKTRDKRAVPLAPGTIHATYACLSGAFSHAIALGLLRDNPCRYARRYLPAIEPQVTDRVRALTLDETRTLLTSPKLSPVRRAMFAFCVFTTARDGEASGLRWGALHLDEPVPWVAIHVGRDGGPTKTRASRRDLPLHPELVPILFEWRAAWARQFKREPTADDLVFPSRNGTVRSNDRTGFRAQIARLGLPRISAHGLRHTGATLYRAAGVSRADVDSMLGHAQGLFDVYAPATTAALAREIARLRVISPFVEGPSTGASPKGVDESAPGVQSIATHMPHSSMDAHASVRDRWSPGSNPETLGSAVRTLIEEIARLGGTVPASAVLALLGGLGGSK